MADSKEKIATCPVCGFQEKATDDAALKEAMQFHMHETHNLALPQEGVSGGTQETGREIDDNEITEVPVVSYAPVTGISSNIPGMGPDISGGEYR